MWSDYGAPVQRRWWKSPRRRTRSSTGLKILLAAGVVVVGVIGISGVYPQVIDAEWVQGARSLRVKNARPGCEGNHARCQDNEAVRYSRLCSAIAAEHHPDDKRGGSAGAAHPCGRGDTARRRDCGDAASRCART